MKKCSCGRPDVCPGYGVCHKEGCGNKTKLHPYSWSKKGWVIREPKLFCKNGHSWRTAKKPTNPCECGCGTLVHKRYVQGHNLEHRMGEDHPLYKKERWKEEHRGFKLGGAPSACWLWQLNTQSQGYAQGRSGESYYLIHRKHYEDSIGPIPEGYHVHHRCADVDDERKLSRRCVCPWHLEAIPPGPHARKHRSPLTEHDVRVIVRSLGMSHNEAAKRYGLSTCSIINIRKCKRWKEVVRDEWTKMGLTGKPYYQRSAYGSSASL